MTTLASVLEQAMELTDADRAELADRLYQSLMCDEPELSQEWKAEIQRREADHSAGRDPDVPWDEARNLLFGTRPE